MNALLLTFLFIGAALSASVNNGQRAEGPACPIASPLDVPAGAINITVGNPNTPGAVIVDISTASRHEGGVATGLNTLWYTYTFTLIGLKVTFAAGIPGVVCIEGDSYIADGSVDFSPFTDAVLPTGSFKGQGTYRACIHDAEAEGHVVLGVNIITGKVSVRELVISNIVFSEVEVNLAGFSINDEVTDWAAWNAVFKQNFDAEWPIHNEAFLERAAEAATYALRDTTLQDIIDIIDPGTTGPPTTCAPTL